LQCCTNGAERVQARVRQLRVRRLRDQAEVRQPEAAQCATSGAKAMAGA